LALHPEPGRVLNPKCEEQVKITMHNRGKVVDLHPEIEDACLPDLAVHCSTNTEPGEELLCLQDKLKELEPNCRQKVLEFTEDEEDHAENNPYVMEHCLKSAKEFCSPYLKKDAEDEQLFDCLVEHKNRMNNNPKCVAAITHFQLITLKDVRITKKFEQACRHDVDKFCKSHRNDDNVDKEEIVECLSEVVLEEALADSRVGADDRVSNSCKEQLMKQLYQQEENIDLNPKIQKLCSRDINEFCPGEEHGSGKVSKFGHVLMKKK
jgi:Golgi apparatus protein 1